MRDTLKEALATPEKGPKVIVASWEYMLNRQRRERPQTMKAARDGPRIMRVRFGVDSNTCTGGHACICLSGRPSLTVKPNPDPMREDPVAAVQDSCVGCGLCQHARGWRNFEALMEHVDRIAGDTGAAALADETGRALELALSPA